MAAPTIDQMPSTPGHHTNGNGISYGAEDVFSSEVNPSSQPYHHRFSSRFDIEPLDLSSTASPSQLKRTIEAHLQETDRRLQDTQQLGTSLLKQREDLTSKLEEVEQFQDEARIPDELRRTLADIEREHADVSREVARALIGPKAKQDDTYASDSAVFTSQGTGSPTKVSAPSRRHRNQPSTRAGDLQFAADISTSLLAQVRQLQTTVAERDESLKSSQAEREAIEQDLLNYSQKIRALDESEQKYKDENWNLETQKHELLNAARDANDKEKRLNASLGAALAEKTRLQNELEDLKMNHTKLSEEHTATRKAHDTEIHSLKRNADMADTERQALQDSIDELTAQNQELAKAISGRSRSRHISPGGAYMSARDEPSERFEPQEESPPPSPTKGTPRHGGLESETLRSSLHHAHRMIQNLKGNIHREKTEKIELKRMLQDARDDLEQRRGDTGSAAKRQKTKPDAAFKKPARPDMLGGSRRARTDVEMADDDWEDHNLDTPTHLRSANMLQAPRNNDARLTDLSDAYLTANETEGQFDTADERLTTESEAFMTGAESMAGDSTDELTETEDGTSKPGRPASGRVNRASMTARSAGDRLSYLSTASTSGDEAELQTPIQSSFARFKLRNSRASYKEQATLAQQGTPESFRSQSTTQDSPATVSVGQSPANGEQSLFAELGGMDEVNSETHSTPARSSTMSSTHSTPGFMFTPSKSAAVVPDTPRRPMVDSSTMTEPWSLESSSAHAPLGRGGMAADSAGGKALLPSAFPLPRSVPASPTRRTDHSTQYTPQRNLLQSPIRPTSSHITPPKTVWDEEHDEQAAPLEPSAPSFDYSGVSSQESHPVQSPKHNTYAIQKQLEQMQEELTARENDLDNMQKSHAIALAAAAAELRNLRDDHAVVLTSKDTEFESLHKRHNTALEKSQAEIENLGSTHASGLAGKEQELEDLRNSHAAALLAAANEHTTARESHDAEFARKESELANLRSTHAAELARKEDELGDLRHSHTEALTAAQVETGRLRQDHAYELEKLASRVDSQKETINGKQAELDSLRNSHAAALAAAAAELHRTKQNHAVEIERLRIQIATHDEELGRKRAELESLRSMQSEELEKLRSQISGHNQEIGTKQTELEKLQAVHNTELESLKRQISGNHQELSTKQTELVSLRSAHDAELVALRGQVGDHVVVLAEKQTELESLHNTHEQELEELRRQTLNQTENFNSKEAEFRSLQSAYDVELTNLHSHVSRQTKALTDKHSEVASLQAAHDRELERLRDQIADDVNALSSREKDISNLQSAHLRDMGSINDQLTAQSEELESARLEIVELNASRRQEVESLKAQILGSNEMLESLQKRHNDELAQKRSQLAEQIAETEHLRQILQAAEAERSLQKPVGYSGILSQETHPYNRPITTSTVRSPSPERPRTAERVVGGGTLISAATALGFNAGRRDSQIDIWEDETSGSTHAYNDQSSAPLKDISGNPLISRVERPAEQFGGPLVKPSITHDQGSQTTLGAGQLEQALRARKFVPPVVIPARNRSPSTRTPTSPTRVQGRPSSRTREVASIAEDPDSMLSSSAPPRSSSVSSVRTSSMVSQNHPPLPSDHRDAIARASSNVGSPSRRENSALKQQGGIMGPPIMPASAMRRPRTPNESTRTTSRVGQSGKRGTVSSQVSRRSSMSSFASEIDERFNIRTDQQGAAQGFEAAAGTDPRMIQAITQTMIGEFLWKYTRKAGSKEMSTTRHRRYFWVHPYTKTLYWSEQDPQTAGRTELKAKSVQIESVRVVSDENPMPPGLHRKSLEVTTPGRKVKFTASTAQRHETWFNALSYLLHRGEGPSAVGTYAADNSHITNDDIAEFRVNGYGARLVPNDSRMSMSSYNSRTTNNTSRRVGRQSMPIGGVVDASGSQVAQTRDVHSPTPQQRNDTIKRSQPSDSHVADKDRTVRANSVSRISKMFGSVTNRTRSGDAPTGGSSSSQPRETSSIYDASIVSDGRRDEEEEARRRREQEQRPGLEDVRACCDGKHHVGSLAHRHTAESTTQNRFSNAINRSMNRRT